MAGSDPAGEAGGGPPASGPGGGWRLRQAASAFLFRSPLYRYSLKGRHPHGLTATPADPWPGDPDCADALFQGRYRFAGEEVTAPNQAVWTASGMSEAWLAELHGFAWLRHFAARGGDAAQRHARALVASWIETFPDWHPLAWRPDVIGRRLIAWLGHGPFIIQNAELTYRSRVLDSIVRQSRHLARAVGLVPGGPPRLAAISGLIYSGVCLPDGRRRAIQGLRLLERELEAQILGDGGHVARNPSVLMAVLRDLVALRGALVAAEQEVPVGLQNAIDRMGPMLRFFRHGDGGLALFNGGREHADGAVDVTLAKAEARGKPLHSAPHSGFERLTRRRTQVLVDVGPPAPTVAGALAHAGLLSFEMSVGRNRLVVNCGAPERGGGEWRQATRATAAHSTLTLADTSQFELRPDGIGGRRPAVRCVRHEADGSVWLETSHDGYVPRFGLVHRRRLYLDASGDDLRGEDRLTPADGRGAAAGRPFAVRFHLHPQVQASLVQSGAVLLRPPTGAGWQVRAAGGEMTIEPSVYAGGGEIRRCEQIVLSGRVEGGDTVVKWAIRRVPD